MLLLKERKVLYTLHVHVPLKGPKKKGYDGVSLPGQPIYSRGIVWMVSCPCQGEVTPIGAVFRAVTGVNMWSNGQGTFWGSVKRSSSVLGHYLRHFWRSRGMDDPFAHVQLIDGQGSRAKIQRGQVVKAFFQRSKILTRVAALDAVPMGVTPPCMHDLFFCNEECCSNQIIFKSFPGGASCMYAD